MKKLMATMLAGACVLSMGSTVFAEDAATTDPYNQDATVTVTTNVPEIDVTLPTAFSVVINPYKLETADGATSIVTAEQTMTNASECAVKITADVMAEVSENSEVKIATAALKGSETTKSVFMYLETTATTGTYADAYDKESENQNIITTKETEVTLAELAATDGTAYFKILGDAASAPETPWKETDTVDVTLKFHITPVAASETTESEGGTT